MAEEFHPHNYQKFAIEKIKELPAVALFLDMGLGKTVCSLSAVVDLLWDSFEVTRVLVVAPKRVAETTWTDEAAKWEHTQRLKLSKVLGSERERINALKANADIFVINRENIPWLMQYYKWRPPFDMLIIDESSSFKNPQAQRFKALRKVMPYFDRVVELTGTPRSNGLMDLWAQMYLLDGGKRLCKTISQYRTRYFTPDKTNGHVVYSYRPLPEAEEKIYDAIRDITFSMSAKDWLELPDRIDNVISVELTPEAKATYKKLEREYVLSLPEGEVQASSAAVLSNKLLQLANGAIYDEEGQPIRVHDSKLEALKELEQDGKNMLVFYAYQHDRERILKDFPKARELKSAKDIQDWNAGKINMLLAHPVSAGYGLNLQAGGNVIVWYGLTWSLEQYQQANARLYRQGQKEAVIIHHLVAKGTIDEQVMRALKNKDAGQQALLEAVKAKINEYRRN